MNLPWLHYRGMRIGAVYFVLMLLAVAAPDPTAKEAHLLCGSSGVVAVYPDMEACSKDPRFKAAKCACFRPTNEWRRWYGFAIVPIVSALIGYLLLQGSLATRLLLLNGVAIAAFATDAIRLIIQHGLTVQLYALPGAPVQLLIFCTSVSAIFLLVNALHRGFRKTSHSGTQ